MLMYLLPHDCVMLAEELQPAHVAEALVQLRRGFDVGEEDRDGAIGRRCGA